MSIRLTCGECGHVWCSEFDDDDCPKCNPPSNYRNKLIYMIDMAEGYQFILENDYGYDLEVGKDYIKNLKKELGII